jgi:hypothetical protein
MIYDVIQQGSCHPWKWNPYWHGDERNQSIVQYFFFFNIKSCVFMLYVLRLFSAVQIKRNTFFFNLKIVWDTWIKIN